MGRRLLGDNLPFSRMANYPLDVCIFVTRNLTSTSLGFIQAFSLTDAKNDVFIEVTFVHDHPNGECMLKLKKNFHGMRDENLT